MRSGRTLALIALVLTSGCLGGGESPDPPPSPPDQAPGDEREPEAPASPAPAPAPALAPGTSWTYRVTGVWDAEDDVTVVLARADASGYLFAGAAPDDLGTEIAWGRAWFGAKDASFRRVDADDLADADAALYFDFPLEDGKSWPFLRGTATARAATVTTPAGAEEGFVMSYAEGEHVREWSYASSVGWFVDYRMTDGGVTYIEATLASMGRSDTWSWYEMGPGVDVDGEPAAAETLELAADFDTVVATIGSWPGGSASIGEPGREPRLYGELGDTGRGFAEGETWLLDTFHATPGTWTVATRPPAEDGTYTYVGLRAVRWLPGP